MIISYETLKTLFKCRIGLDELTKLLTAQGLEVEAVYRNPSIENFSTAQVAQRTDEGYLLRFHDNKEIMLETAESLERDISYVVTNMSGSWALVSPESLKWGASKKPLTVPGGLSINTAWEWDDVMIELSVTPNRGDCLSYLGIAREIFLALRQPFHAHQWVADIKQRYPLTYEGHTKAHIDVQSGIARYYALMQVSCPRFESPFWLQRFLLKHGYQPKLPAVDAGHYWMLLLGLPSHAFDAAAFNGKVSLKYHNFEQPYTWKGVQGTSIHLSGNLPIIIDEYEKILCLAGAMGGADSASSPHSQRVLIEAAAFLPQAIRPLRACVPVTPSSLRFERGVWPFGQADLLELIGGMLCSFHPQVRCAKPLVSYEKEWDAPILRTTRAQVEKLTGRSFDAVELASVLALMGATVDGDNYEWAVPCSRFDLKIEQNFIGEIVRCYGLDTLQQCSGQAAPRPRRALLSRPAIDPWIAHGAQEVVTYSFVKQSWAQASGPAESEYQDCYIIQNPISDDMRVMRPSLLPSLCELLSYHGRHQLDLVPLVELAPTYHKSFDGGQKLRLSAVWPQKCAPRYWAGANKEIGFYDIKGLLEAVLPTGIEFIIPEASAGCDKLYHPQLQAQVLYQGHVIGGFGLLSPRAAQQFEWPLVWLIDIDADFRDNVPVKKTFKAFSKRPFVVRDWVFLISDSLQAEQLAARVRSYQWPHCQHVRIFDFYVDASGQRSVGIEVRFQASDRSLTDDDLQPLTSHIITDFSEHFGAKLKE